MSRLAKSSEVFGLGVVALLLVPATAIAGQELAHLSDLSGREFFDAVVRIDQVSAVSVQVRGR